MAITKMYFAADKSHGASWFMQLSLENLCTFEIPSYLGVLFLEKLCYLFDSCVIAL